MLAILIAASPAHADEICTPDGCIDVGTTGNGGSSGSGSGQVDTGIGSQTGGRSGGDSDSSPAGSDHRHSSSSSGGEDAGDQVKPSCTEAKPLDPQPDKLDSRWGGADPAKNVLYERQCLVGFRLGPGAPDDPVWTTVYVVGEKGEPAPPPPPPDPAVVAGQVWAHMRTEIPAPGADTSPDFASAIDPKVGLGRTYVNLWNWFWAPAAVWHPVTETLTSNGVSVTVTAAPTGLVFDPGDGDSPVSCGNAPGLPFAAPDPGAADQNPDPNTAQLGGCGYRYTTVHSSADPVTATVSIPWHVTWSSNVGRTGDLGMLTTWSDTPPFVVEQIDVVLVPNPTGGG